jgi:ABC-type multidrug transport system fused ATPase/permease subunit
LTAAAIAGATSITISACQYTIQSGATALYYDHMYMVGNNATVMYRYQVGTNAWATTNASAVAIPAVTGAVGGGCGIKWLPSYDADKLYIVRGNGTANIYTYSLSGNTFATQTFYPSTETYTTASAHTARSIAGKGYSIISSKEATMRIYEYDPSLSRLHPKMNQWLYPTGAAVQGDRATCLRSTDDKVEFITLMAGSDSSSVNEMYKVMENLPISVQKVIGPKMDMDKIKSIAILLACLYIISAIFSYVEGLSMIKVANGYAKKLRSSISEKINKLPLKFFDHNLSGDILSRVTNDVDTIAQSLNNSLSTLVSSITLFIGSIIMMFVTNYIMAITAIVSSLIGFILMFIILNKSQRYFTARQRELGKLNGYIEEIYSGLNVVRSCNAKDETINEFDKLNDKLYDCNRKR